LFLYLETHQRALAEKRGELAGDGERRDPRAFAKAELPELRARKSSSSWR